MDRKGPLLFFISLGLVTIGAVYGQQNSTLPPAGGGVPETTTLIMAATVAGSYLWGRRRGFS